ncbi:MULTISPECIES: PliI family lysozyme inhibitor of I-type lysozyme [Sphingobacterium]|uniref:PliI family lysozyme inhibitor of I-type lysozyme n=1 Tax=Sphingobacterium kitahiroshimense TaxID=470446 RepID=A0ABV0C0Q8_9SPHI|nr:MULTISPECIES: PliI family lysozyme inhibitor of I-type lysozyme [unclassified Sphingobacterium]MCS3554192.1 hypothetical protein [Sphingobacterium sp. JUb21]NJI74230.1 hypothetical protein [Sphingobacterium sp. B16(2022)]TCR08025.1 hypothetical protein EDF66_104130 [Sphingobacterium sp. JUb20]
MYILKSMIVSGFFLLTLNSCNQPTSKTQAPAAPSETAPTLTIDGNYVTAEYDKRAEGFDWVGVTIKSEQDSSITIQVRSRADNKKPTCTLDAKATKTKDNTYRATLEGKAVLFAFDATSLTITPENPADAAVLNFYCSGGGSLAGTYKKNAEALDPTQIDKTSYQKTLSLQGITFDIQSINKDGKEQLSITPAGLSVDNQIVTHDITGETVLNAEIEDMNSDGYPELLIYTQSHGSGSYGNVIGYSVNNGKSMSTIFFPSVSENAKINQGYQGHDEFAMVETSLAQRFPIYKDRDTNAKPTGKTRQIEYELKDGEASRKLVVKKVSEF